MSVKIQALPARGSINSPDGGLVLDVYPSGNRCIVEATGELDMATRHQLAVAAISGNHRVMVIDLAAVTFMDCSGYGAIVLSRLLLERDGRTLRTRGQTGQPARLMQLIESLERTPTAA